MRHWAALPFVLGFVLTGCGGGGPTTPALVTETFTGDLTSADSAQLNALSFPVSITQAGALTASVSWVVLSPGSGTYAGSQPSFAAFLDDGDLVLASGGPSPTPPVGLSATVSAREYVLKVANLQLCGGCVVRVTAHVSHP